MKTNKRLQSFRVRLSLASIQKELLYIANEMKSMDNQDALNVLNSSKLNSMYKYVEKLQVTLKETEKLTV